MAMILIIDAPYMYAACIVEKGIVTSAAPILKWTIGKKRYDILKWIRNKKFKFIIINDV